MINTNTYERNLKSDPTIHERPNFISGASVMEETKDEYVPKPSTTQHKSQVK
jgi:hypothetical protein